MKLIKKSCYARRISPLDGAYFFGYYDLQPFYQNLHLTHKVDFDDRLHRKGDRAQIGLLDIHSEKFEKLDETGAWCFQQGSMLQWNPAAPGKEIIYNSLDEGAYNATILNIHNGKKRFLDRPVANVSPKGDYALSINMSRLYDFRPGYGYGEYEDSFYHENHSDKDGIFLTDLQTGSSRLILSLEEIWEFSKEHFGGKDQKMVVNHITFNTDGSRFLFLVRNFPQPGKRHDTAVITANRDGSDLYLLSDYGMKSHYYWMDREHVVFWCDGRGLDCASGDGDYYILKDKTHEGCRLTDTFFYEDAHMSFLKDNTLMLGDSYQDEREMRKLHITSFEKQVCVELGRFYSIPVPPELVDIRCDLHPRWNPNGKMISFDSTHEGQRGVYVMDVESVEEIPKNNPVL